MRWNDWFEKWGMTKLLIKPPFMEMEIVPKKADRDAAYDMYIELVSRITTQFLPIESGSDKTAADSIYAIFPATRDITKKHGRDAVEFAKLAITILNQIIRPFTTKWHAALLTDNLSEVEHARFRAELDSLRAALRVYIKMLADMAEIDEFTLGEKDGANDSF
tara:strand:+ start:109 stop:597 length:489 start_codon:yes stop_codon:yes gene_type:complete